MRMLVIHATNFFFFPITTELWSTDPLALIALAHGRSTLQPEEYVAHDMDQLMMGVKQLAFPPTYAPVCIFMSGERFGHFIQEFRADEVHSKNAYPTHVALLILERQAVVLRMLRAIIQRLSRHSHTACLSTSEIWNTPAAENFRKREARTTAYRWNDGIFESPIPNLQLMNDLVSAYYTSQQDELASIFLDVGHTLQMIRDYQEFVDAGNYTRLEDTSIATVTGAMFAVFENVISWHAIKEMLSEFITAAEACQAEGRPIRLENQGYVLIRFKHFVYQMMQKSLDDFAAFNLNPRTFTTNPKRRQQFGSEPTWKILGFRSLDRFYRQDRLVCLLDRMLDENHRNIPQVLLELHRVLQDKRQARGLTCRVWQLISKIGILWRLVEACRYFRPSIPEPEPLFHEKFSKLWARYDNALRHGELPLETGKGQELERHFSELKVPRHSESRPWLGSPQLTSSRFV